jgi:hypothetical protein
MDVCKFVALPKVFSNPLGAAIALNLALILRSAFLSHAGLANLSQLGASIRLPTTSLLQAFFAYCNQP